MSGTYAGQAGEPKIYSILNDFAFQWIFGREGNEKLTISLLNAILRFEDDRRIEELQYLNPFNMRRFRRDKLTVVDVKARDCRGRWYNIEAQACEHEAYIARTAYYVAKLYSSQIFAGDNYTALNSATSISIMNFDLFENSDQVHEIFELRNRNGQLVLDNSMSLHYIDLTKFNRDKPRSLRTPFEKWLDLMKFSHIYGKMGVEIPPYLDEEVYAMAIAQHRQLNANEKMRRRMEERERCELDIALIRGAAYDKGVARGHSLGKTEGLIEGLAKGKIEGKAEGKAEGKIEGRGEGAAGVIKTVLVARFGEVPAELLARIDAVSALATLQQLAAAAATATSIEDFAAHLPPA